MLSSTFSSSPAAPGQGHEAPANMDFSLDTRFPARCGELRRTFAPYNTSPTTVAYSGRATCSGRSANPFGSATRTGRWNDCSASSSRPCSLAAPPAKTNPAGIWPSRPARCKSSRMRESNSHGARLDDVRQHVRENRAWRTIADADDLDRAIGLHERERRSRGGVLILSASGMGVRNPTARSFVK